MITSCSLDFCEFYKSVEQNPVFMYPYNHRKLIYVLLRTYALHTKLMCS